MKRTFNIHVELLEVDSRGIPVRDGVGISRKAVTIPGETTTHEGMLSVIRSEALTAAEEAFDEWRDEWRESDGLIPKLETLKESLEIVTYNDPQMGAVLSAVLSSGIADHLVRRDPVAICDTCGRKSYASETPTLCNMPQPDMTICPGRMKPRQHKPWWAGKDVVGYLIRRGWKVEDDGLWKLEDNGRTLRISDKAIIECHDAASEAAEQLERTARER